MDWPLFSDLIVIRKQGYLGRYYAFKPLFSED